MQVKSEKHPAILIFAGHENRSKVRLYTIRGLEPIKKRDTALKGPRSHRKKKKDIWPKAQHLWIKG